MRWIDRELWESIMGFASVLLILFAVLSLAILTGAALALDWALGWIGR